MELFVRPRPRAGPRPRVGIVDPARRRSAKALQRQECSKAPARQAVSRLQSADC